jgi:hypothetical protein
MEVQINTFSDLFIFNNSIYIYLLREREREREASKDEAIPL